MIEGIMFVFFQAEDGIRDLVRSRGLGDVYKRQGTGKSVLIKCIVGLEDIDEGELEILGENFAELNNKQLIEIRKKIGFLFQSGALYDSMTVRENLEFPLRRKSESISKDKMNELVIEALHNVGLDEAINKSPSELSGGMRKRLGLARTLILKPEIMLYDEPTTCLLYTSPSPRDRTRYRMQSSA